MNELTAAQRDYLAWLKRTAPAFYADTVQPYLSEAALGSIGATEGTSTFQNILNSITGALPSITSAYSQYATTQAQIQQRTLEQQMLLEQQSAGGSSILPWVIGGGLLLGALMLMNR